MCRTDENLQTNFSPFGKISSAHVMIDRASKSSRGFGFVTSRSIFGILRVGICGLAVITNLGAQLRLLKYSDVSEERKRFWYFKYPSVDDGAVCGFFYHSRNDCLFISGSVSASVRIYVKLAFSRCKFPLRYAEEAEASRAIMEMNGFRVRKFCLPYSF